MGNLLDCNVAVVREVSLGIKRQEEKNFSLGFELGRHLSCCDDFVLLDVAVDLVFHVMQNLKLIALIEDSKLNTILDMLFKVQNQ